MTGTTTAVQSHFHAYYELKLSSDKNVFIQVCHDCIGEADADFDTSLPSSPGAGTYGLPKCSHMTSLGLTILETLTP
jgi:hypothetical protein